MFPYWAFIAIGGHLANGVAFIIDKSLLSKSFKRPATYASTVGFLGMLALILIPFGVSIPSAFGWIWSIISGITFVLALLTFFSALSRGEATRIVPIIGSLIPILTLVGTTLFLGERLAGLQYLGFGLLILATIILAGGSSTERVSGKTILIAISAALLFAISSVTIKLGYDADGFMTTFTVSRIFGALTAVFLLFFDRRAFTEAKEALFPSKTSNADEKAGRGALLLVLMGQSLGALGFVLVQYAINLGSASIVNSLQAIQYALLVIAAFIFAKKAPTLLGETLTPRVITQKVIAILIVGLGLWFVV